MTFEPGGVDDWRLATLLEAIFMVLPGSMVYDLWQVVLGWISLSLSPCLAAWLVLGVAALVG